MIAHNKKNISPKIVFLNNEQIIIDIQEMMKYDKCELKNIYEILKKKNDKIEKENFKKKIALMKKTLCNTYINYKIKTQPLILLKQ